MKKITLLSSLMILVFGSLSISAHAATWYLQGYVDTDDWNTLANWYSQPLGGGAHPTSISSSDNFDLNGYRLDTPGISTGTATFGGNSLILHGGSGGNLADKSTPPALVVIPTLVSDGGVIGNWTSGTQSINITTFTNNANTTLGAAVSKGLIFTIGTLSGAGDICVIGSGGGTAAGGTILMTVTTATGFTGTLHVADGCQLTFGNAITSGGALDVDSSSDYNSVTVNYTVTFKGLTINGVAQVPGTYTAASLGAPFTGTGSVVVQAAAPAGTFNLTQSYGVNLPGGSFASAASYPTDLNEWSYYQGKGLNLVRVPFLWERLQPTLTGTLSPSDLASLDAAVSLAAAEGMQVILDMHNYDHRTVSGVSYLIGSSEVPNSDYQDVWQKLAAHFAGEPGIYGYDIMNEPTEDSGTWDTTTAQYGVNGVRQSDTTHYVIVEGDSNAGAQVWMTNNANLNVTDSANKLIYSAHSYWDSNNSGAYSGTYNSNNEYPNYCIDQMAQFVYWLELKGAKGFVGEFAVPTNVSSPDYRWNVLLDNALYYLNNNGVNATYWSGGECWQPTENILCATGTPPVDTPCMSVLEDYGNIATNPFVTGVSLNSLGTPSDSAWRGMQINVGAAPLTVTQLGRWVVSGNTGTHTMELVNASTGAVLGSVSVNTSGATAGAFDYVSLATPVTLLANSSYYIASYEPSGGDQDYYDETTVTPTSAATVPNSIYSTNGATWSPNRTTNHCFVPVSFQYEYSPAKSFVTSVSTSSGGTPTTNDWYGMQINMGAVPVTVTQLGRYVISGNSGTHTLELVNASTGAVLGSVSVNTAGAATGTFAYATLATPVTLAANANFYLASQETSGGDQMYFDETTVIPASVGTVPNSIYSTNGTTWSPNRTTNHCYVPVNFVYH